MWFLFHGAVASAEEGAGAGAGAGEAAEAAAGVGAAGRGLHSFTLELNLSHFGTHSWVKLGYTVGRRAQIELKPERV